MQGKVIIHAREEQKISLAQLGHQTILGANVLEKAIYFEVGRGGVQMGISIVDQANVQGFIQSICFSISTFHTYENVQLDNIRYKQYLQTSDCIFNTCEIFQNYRHFTRTWYIWFSSDYKGQYSLSAKIHTEFVLSKFALWIFFPNLILLEFHTGLFHLHSRQFKFQFIHILIQSVRFQFQKQLNRYLNQ